jgi:type I restriction enzyme S subunit
VVCIGSTIGKVSLTIEETTTNQQINTIVSNRKMYDPDGLYYFTLFYIQKPLRIEAGLQAVPIVNKSKFAKIKIPIPPLPEQHYIASILSQIDETIEKEQKYREKLERIKQGLMEDLLAGKVRVKRLIKEGVESV